MHFPEEYFEDEVRNGFYVTGMMKRCWAAQLEVLSEIDRVCRRHQIQWFADCGTLLGAVRHGGFIPWDDDLDICMMREDYDRFSKIAREELPKGYVVRDYHDRDYWELLLRVNNSLYLDFDAETLEKYHEFPFIAGVDIFPIDRMAPTEKEEQSWRELTSFAFSLTAQKDLEDGSRMSRETKQAIWELERAVGHKLAAGRSVKEQIFDWLMELFSRYRDVPSKEVILTPYWIINGSHRYREEWFSDIVELPFETGTIRAPARYDAVLRTEYGEEYMRPVRMGGVHDYPYYEELERMLKDANQGYYPFWYEFDEKALQRKADLDGNKPKKKLEEYAAVLTEAHEELIRLMKTGDRQTALALLTQCQTLAIQQGTLIEGLYGEGFETVKLIEEYCELIYRVSEGEAEAETLKNAYACAEKNMRDRVTGRREIVFLPWKADAWSTMEEAYRAACSDPACDVYVIPIPYYRKKAYNEPDGLKYEGDRFPEDVPIVHYQDYDIAKRCPNEIVIQMPYDGCAYTMTATPFFYAENLRKYTDRLVYIPWFETDEPEAGDARAKKSMAHYVSVPGVVYADRVYVQSEHMKDAYVEFLTEWAGETTRPVWEEKIAAAPWKKKVKAASNHGKTRILYFTSISRLLEYKDEMLEKMREVFRLFSEEKNHVTLVWYPDPLIEQTLPDRYPALWKGFQALKEQFLRENIGILDNGTGKENPAETAAAYYGDPCALVQQFRERKLPVMLEDVMIKGI